MECKEFADILKWEGLPDFIPRQINSLFSVCQSYWTYYCQYENLKRVQSILQNYYKDGEFQDEKFDIYERLVVKLLWDNNRKNNPDLSEKDFFEFYLSDEECLRKDLKKIHLGDKTLSKSIYEHNAEREFDMHIKGLKLEEYGQAMKKLEENQEPQPKTVEESMESILDEKYAEYLLSCARQKDDAGYFCLQCGIADIRYSLTTGVITNHTPSGGKKKKRQTVYFKPMLSKNEGQLKEAINKILEKYPISIVEEYKVNMHEIEEIRKQAGLL